MSAENQRDTRSEYEKILERWEAEGFVAPDWVMRRRRGKSPVFEFTAMRSKQGEVAMSFDLSEEAMRFYMLGAVQRATFDRGGEPPVQTESVGRVLSLEEMLAQRAQFAVEVFEDNAGGVYLRRVGEAVTWCLGPVTPDLEGRFGEDIVAWRDGQWTPGEMDEEPLHDLSGLQLIATWSRAGLVAERSRSGDFVAGAGGRAYIGLSDEE